MIGIKRLFISGLALGFALAPLSAMAESIQNLLPPVLQNHDRLAATRAKVVASENRAREALGAWFPTLSLDGNYGFEEKVRPNAKNTQLDTWEFDIALTQLLWDFGASNGQIEAARLAMGQSKAMYDAERQGLILEATQAYINLLRSARILEIARQSEANVRRQTGLEQTRVDRGSGLSTDVLQAKTQLAGAEARRIQAEGALEISKNRFKAVYGILPGALTDLVPVAGPDPSSLPATLDDALAMAQDDNPSLRAAKLAAAVQRQVVRATRGNSLFPTIQLVGENIHKNNVDSVRGHKIENTIKVKASWDINLGLTAINTLRAAQSDAVSADRTFADSRNQVEEKIRNAWQNLQTFRANSRILANQANIASEFLNLARRERQLGQRSLIDLLAGETALYNAQADAYSAQADVIIASYNLMANIGTLEMDQVK
ncbi:TolC family protein [Rhodospirillum sp. A1_3_36]|uniref:TolC family protein n=1 Tax=Rhodospirillum sp. A1_3_36 TaxID=3391666 RepID=UPI0039A5478C